MTTYICKCGRRVQKSSNADNTGNRIENYRPGFECYGCPYAMPWGRDKWDEETKHFVQDVKGYECRMSKTLSYASQFIGSTKDKCTCSVVSLDFDFLEQISVWVKQTFTLGELTGHFSRDEIRATDYCYDGRYKYTLCCASNKSGVAAKVALFAQFFTPDGSRKDMTPQQEMEKILADIKKATHPELPQPYHVGDIYANFDGSIRMRIVKVGIGFVIQEGTADEWEPAGKGVLYPHLTHAIEMLADLVRDKDLKPTEKEEPECATVPNADAAATMAERAVPNATEETLTTSASVADASESYREKSPSCSSSAPSVPAESSFAGVVAGGTSSPNLTAPASTKMPTAFDFSALGDLSGQAEEADQQFDLHYGTAQDEYLISCIYVAKMHALTAKAGRYGGGTWTKWYESKGLSEGSARTMTQNGDAFKSATVADLKLLPSISRKDLNLIARSGCAEQLTAAAGDSQRVQELLAQIRAKDDAIAAEKERADKAEAERDEACASQRRSDKNCIQLGLKASQEKERADKAEQRAKDAESQLSGSRQVAEAAKLGADKLKAENDALKKQPIVGVTDPEVDRLAHQQAYGIAADMTDEIKKEKDALQKQLKDKDRQLNVMRRQVNDLAQTDFEIANNFQVQIWSAWNSCKSSYSRLVGEDLESTFLAICQAMDGVKEEAARLCRQPVGYDGGADDEPDV